MLRKAGHFCAYFVRHVRVSVDGVQATAATLCLCHANPMAGMLTDETLLQLGLDTATAVSRRDEGFLFNEAELTKVARAESQ